MLSIYTYIHIYIHIYTVIPVHGYVVSSKQISYKHHQAAEEQKETKRGNLVNLGFWRTEAKKFNQASTSLKSYQRLGNLPPRSPLSLLILILISINKILQNFRYSKCFSGLSISIYATYTIIAIK